MGSHMTQGCIPEEVAQFKTGFDTFMILADFLGGGFALFSNFVHKTKFY
jgi:hypothetical protein